MSFLKNLFSGKDKSPQELIVEGKYQQALDSLLAIKKSKKKLDPVISFQIADVYVRMKKPQEALPYYIKVGDYYGEMGFFNKSVASFKKALNISPGNEEILEKLAAFHDKVPKYMIDDKFLNKARGKEESQSTQDENEFADFQDMGVEDVDDEHTGMLDMEEFEGDHEVVELGFDDLGSEVMGADFTSHDVTEHPLEAETVQEIPDPLQLPEPENDQFSPDDTIPAMDMDAVMGEGVTDDEPVIQTGAETQPDISSEDLDYIEDIEEEEEDTLWNQPLDLEEDDTDQQEPPQAETETKPEEKQEKTVFAARTEETNTAEIGAMEFGSLDEALDNVLIPVAKKPAPKPPPPAPAPDPDPAQSQQEDTDQKQWPLFRTMPKDTFLAFVLALEDQDYYPGEYIVKQGEQGAEMYLISDGKVNVEVDIDGETKTVASLGSGDFFGEASLITHKPRNASVVCTEMTNVLRLTKKQLVKLCKDHPQVLGSIKKIYLSRSKQNRQKS